MSQELVDATAVSAMDEMMKWGAANRSPYTAMHAAAAEKALAGTIADATVPRTLTETVIDSCRNRETEFARSVYRNGTAVEKLVSALAYEVKKLQDACRCAADELKTFRTRNRCADLSYDNVFCAALDRNVEVGYDFHPAEPGDDEQPEVPAYANVIQVWAGGFNLTDVLQNLVFDQLGAEIEAMHRGAK